MSVGSVARALKLSGPQTTKHAAARRPLLRLVPSARPGRPLAPFVVLMLGLLVAGLMGLLLLNTWTAQDAFRLHTLQGQQSQLDDTEQALRQQVDDSTDPSVLAAHAQALGMVPGNPAPLFVRPNGTVIGASALGVPGKVSGTKQGNLLIVQGPVPPPAPPSAAATPSAAGPTTAASTKAGTQAAATTGTHPATTPSAAASTGTKTTTAKTSPTAQRHPSAAATGPSAHPTHKPTRP